jgi:hypothetical protein
LSRRSLYAVANNHPVAVTASGRWAWFWQHFESLCGNPSLKHAFAAFFLNFVRSVEVESGGDSFAGPIDRRRSDL